MLKRFGVIIPLIFSLLLAGGLVAQTSEKSENVTSGVKEVEPGFQVFPIDKLGNTLYLEGKKLVSRNDLVLRGITDAPDGYVYYGVNESEEPVLGYLGPDSVKFDHVASSYYQLTTTDGKKKLFRVTNDNKIQNLLPRSNTGAGLVYNGTNKAAFFHITKGENVETEDGKERYQYTFRIHVVKDGDPNVINLPDEIKDFRSSLRMDWTDQNTLQCTLSNGQKETIVIK